MILTLLQNISLLVSIAVVFHFVERRLGDKPFLASLLGGLLFGLVQASFLEQIGELLHKRVHAKLLRLFLRYSTSAALRARRYSQSFFNHSGEST